MNKTITVLGAGVWATTVGSLLARKEMRVIMWAREPAVARELNAHHTNSRYLPNAVLPQSLTGTANIRDAVCSSRLVLFCIPTQSLRKVARLAAPHLQGHEILVNLGKALEHGSFARPTQILQQEVRQCHVFATLSGPNIAQEVFQGIPSKAVISCTDFKELDALHAMFDQENFRVYTNADLVGVELAAALKNVYAIMAGICDGLGYGENTKGALLCRALAEMVRVGIRLGGNRDTFYGLAGMGDLFATATSPQSRNRSLGEAMVKYGDLKAAMATLSGRVAEGIETTRALKTVRAKLKIEIPIAEEIYEILFERKPCADAFKSVWARSPESEIG